MLILLADVAGERPSDLWIQIAALGITAIGLAVTGTWQLGKMRDDMAAEITRQRKEVDIDLEAHKSQTGEAVAAIRQKVTDNELAAARNELEMYKTFVRRDTFSEAIGRLERSMSAQLTELKTSSSAQFSKLESKIERLAGWKKSDAE